MKHQNHYHCPTIQARRQSGVILIVTMIMLVLISVASVSAIKGSESSEAVTNNARTQQLAMQAAEAALLSCEQQTTTYLQGLIAASQPGSTATTPTLPFEIESAPLPDGSGNYVYQWRDLANVWDNPTSTLVTVLLLDLVNGTSANIFAAYQRAPECVVQMYEPGNNSRAVITARGFGPEVAPPRGRPNGSEVWLQSVIQVASASP